MPIGIDRCCGVFDVPIGVEGDLNLPLTVEGFNQNMSGLNVRPYFGRVRDLRKRMALDYPFFDCFFVRQVMFEQVMLDFRHE